MGTRCNKRSANLPPAGESLGRVGRADHKAEPGEGAQVATPSRRRLHPDDASPGSEARSASRRRRRACRYPPSGLGGVSKSSSRARRSVPHSRPAVRFLKRAVAAVKRRCGREDRDPAARTWRIGPVAHLHRPSPSRRRRRLRQRRRLKRRRLRASSPLVRAVLGLPRRYITFPLPMVQGACCCVATSPGAHASRASATAALNVLSGSWLVL